MWSRCSISSSKDKGCHEMIIREDMLVITLLSVYIRSRTVRQWSYHFELWYMLLKNWILVFIYWSYKCLWRTILNSTSPLVHVICIFILFLFNLHSLVVFNWFILILYVQKEEACQRCGKNDNLVSCSTCTYAFHRKCLVPCLNITSDKWSCPECVCLRLHHAPLF